MKRLLRKLLNLQPGEGRSVAIMTTYLFLLIATLLVIKPVRNSLFLSRFGVEMLPYAFLAVAGTSVIFISGYTRLARKLRLDRLIQGTLITNIVLIVAFWIPLQLGFAHDWLYFTLYVWVALFGVVVSTQFWLLANYVFDVRQAKRVFGVVGAGGIAGGIFGGYFTTWLAPIAGSEDLLLFGALFLGICIVLVQRVWEDGARDTYREQTQRRRRRRDPAAQSGNVFTLLRQNRLLALTASLVGVGVVVANLVDYQYSAIASQIITDEDELTAFFGFWLSTLSVFSFGLQLFLTGRIIRRLGVGTSLQFLPTGVAAGSIAVLLSGGLAAAVSVKLLEGGFKQSVHKAGLELLNLPIPATVKNRMKAFIDVLVDNLATGLGGLILLLATGVLGWNAIQIGYIVLTLVVIWVALNVAARREYIQAFRSAIERRSLHVEEERVNVDDPELQQTLIAALDSGNDRQINYALDLMRDLRDTEVFRRLHALLTAPSSPDVLTRVLAIVTNAGDDQLKDVARPLLDHDDPDVRLAALEYLVRVASDPVPVLEPCFASASVAQRITALRVAADRTRIDRELRESIDIKAEFESLLALHERQLDDPVSHADLSDPASLSARRVEIAEVLGRANEPDLYPYLHMLMADDDVQVLRAAVLAAGRTRSVEFLPTLFAHLNTKYVRRTARVALSLYGNTIIPELRERLHDPKEDLRIRLSLPAVLAGIGTQAAAEALHSSIIQENVVLQDAVVQALNRLRAEYADLRIDKRSIEMHVFDSLQTYYWLLGILKEQREAKVPRDDGSTDSTSVHRARQLLIRALEERLDRKLETIFRLLGLQYEPEDMNNAYAQLHGSTSDLKADAIEFLDNVLKPRLKRAIMPLVESNSIERKLQRGRELFAFTPPTGRSCYEELLRSEDNWLKVCTLYYIGESRRFDLYSIVKVEMDDPDPMVRETAELAADRIDQDQTRLDI